MTIIEPDNQIYNDTQGIGVESNTVEKDSILSATVGIHWQGQDCSFTDWSYIPGLNLWRDYLPEEIHMNLQGLGKGAQITQHFSPGDLVDKRDSSQLLKIANKQFQPPKKGLAPITSAVGRFYPRDFFGGVPGIYQGNKLPCRIISIDGNQLTVDLNHPLAGKEIDMIFNIDSIKKAGAGRGGRCNDIPSIVCNLGPGMQDRLSDRDTDFWQSNPFSRLDAGIDSAFFKQPRLTPFWDSVALKQVTEQYNNLIPQNAHVLDLMAGVHSPLQESDIKPSSITCAGLNQQELDANPVCSDRVILDVNTIKALPFEKEQFDVVLIHAAIEYVINPEMLFTEISRVLKPAGRVIVSFTNRSVPEKAIQLWTDAHEFERPAIVLSYLRSTGTFGNYNSFSKRGLFRPEDDELADRLLLSDPVYVVCGDKNEAI